LALVYEAVLVVTAGVDQILPDCSLKESFAALTAVHPIVLPWGGKGRPSAGRQTGICPSLQHGRAQTNSKGEENQLQGMTLASLTWLWWLSAGIVTSSSQTIGLPLSSDKDGPHPRRTMQSRILAAVQVQKSHRWQMGCTDT